MKLPQFTIRDLLLSTAMIAIAVGVPVTTYRLNGPLAIGFLCFFVSPSLLLAGIGLPFGYARQGAYLGIVVVLVMLVLPTIGSRR